MKSNRSAPRFGAGMRFLALSSLMMACAALCPAQDQLADSPATNTGSQINVNWLYGSFVPKDVPLKPLDSSQRLKLYFRQTYTTPGIYLKTMGFTLADQANNAYPEWGDGFGGFAKRLGTREAEFVIQNSVTALGDGIFSWEPRYDRCRCSGFWARTRHAIIRDFVTYDSTDRSLRPQLFPYVGAFTGRVVVTTWKPGNPNWRVEGYQAVITQVPYGIGANLVAEFAPEIVRMIRRKPKAN